MKLDIELIEEMVQAGATGAVVLTYLRHVEVSREKDRNRKPGKQRNGAENSGNARKSTEVDGKTDDKFGDFWTAYPKRKGANPKEPARKKFLSVVQMGADAEMIVGSARKYADELRDEGKVGTEYVAQAVTWLNQQRWKDYEPKSGVAQEALEAEVCAKHGYVWSDAEGKFVKTNQDAPAENH